MAAGLGSRFGGVKQLAIVGPSGEAILDYSIRDAQAAGFGPTVLIVRSDIEADVRAHLAEVHGPDADFRFVRQDDFGPARAKPWGTLHAILSASEALDRPFAVINADDYYGAGSFFRAAEDLAHAAPGHATNIAFNLGNTVPPQARSPVASVPSRTVAWSASSRPRNASVGPTAPCGPAGYRWPTTRRRP